MNTKSFETTIDKISNIHKVDGFDPATLAVEYADLNSGEIRKRLPVMSQMAWFRLMYPEGKISVTAELVKDYYVGHAKVYRNYMDPPDCFLAEATASRTYDPEKPTVSPREWAQTAAVGIALRNAGFGLQFHAAGDAFDQLAVDELGDIIKPPLKNNSSESFLDNSLESDVTDSKTEITEVAVELPPEDAFQNALKMPCPIAKYSGKTLGDLLMDGEISVLIWIANKFTSDPAIAAGAKLICETSLQQSA